MATLDEYLAVHPELEEWAQNIPPGSPTAAQKGAAWDAVYRAWIATEPNSDDPNGFWLDLMFIANWTGMVPQPLPTIPDPQFEVELPWKRAATDVAQEPDVG